MGYFRFFYTLRTFYRPAPYPMHEKKLQKNPSNYYLWKVKKFYGDSVKNESARAKPTRGGPNACLGLRKMGLNSLTGVSHVLGLFKIITLV